jgi:hypothetical protein
MALYSIPRGSQLEIRNSLVAAFTAAGILDTVHYNVSDTLILTTTIFSKVLKFVISSAVTRPLNVYYGDAYASGVTITNQVILTETATNTVSYAYLWLIITPNTIVFVDTSSFAVHVVIFGKGATSAKELVLIFTRSMVPYQSKNVTDGIVVHPTGIRGGTILTAEGNYYKSPIILLQNGSILDNAVVDVELLHRDNAEADNATIVGDDVIVTSGRANGMTVDTGWFNAMLLIKDGNL